MEQVVTDELKKRLFNSIENWKFDDAIAIVNAVDPMRRQELLELRQNGILLRDRFRFTLEAMGGKGMHQSYDKYEKLLALVSRPE